METPFIGEIRAFGFNFVPQGWAPCDGRVLPISDNQALAALLGDRFGGDGRTTFALPDLRGRTPTGVDSYRGEQVGARGGFEYTTLDMGQMPAHTHEMQASAEAADQFAPTNERSLAVTTMPVYNSGASLTPMAGGTTSSVGAGQSFINVQPSVVMSYCICLTGIFPPRQ